VESGDVDPDDWTVQACVQAIHKAAAIKALIPTAVFKLKPLDPEIAKKRAERYAGNPATLGTQYDKNCDRMLVSLRKRQQVNYRDVNDRIQRDAEYREKLRNYLLNIDAFPFNARFYMSRYCRHALAVSRTLGEVPPVDPPRQIQLRDFP